MLPVYISMTSIPSRLDRIVPERILTLMSQDHTIARIVLSLPKNNMRGQVWESKWPDFLTRSPYSSLISIVRPDKDLGPIMKYFGILEYQDLPEECYVCSVDDDQIYCKNLVSTFMSVSDKDTCVSGGVCIKDAPFGYGGVCMHVKTLRRIYTEYLRVRGSMSQTCSLVDDDVMMMLYRRLQIKVQSINLAPCQLFHEHTDSLHNAHNRIEDQKLCVDSLARIGPIPPVYISMTTIPSRMNRIVSDRIVSLIDQTYPVERIVLTCPLENMRGQLWDDHLPDFLSNPPYVDRITVVRPQKDLGPIMKYFGFLEIDSPEDCYICIVDDDQLYGDTMVSDFVTRIMRHTKDAQRNTVVACSSSAPFGYTAPAGFAGLFLHKSVLVRVFAQYQQWNREGKLKPCCQMIDDDVVGAIYRELNVNIDNMSCPGRIQFHENTDGLRKAHARRKDQKECLRTLGYTEAYHTEMVALLTIMSLILSVYFVFLGYGVLSEYTFHQDKHSRLYSSGRYVNQMVVRRA